MRIITVDMTTVLVPGLFVWLFFVEYGFVPVMITEVYSKPQLLKTKSVFTGKEVNVAGWYKSYKDGNIIISPN